LKIPKRNQSKRKETTVDNLEQMQQAIESIRDDYNKAKGGNRAAGTRVRKVMQDVKNLAQAIRAEMLESRKES
jgi:histone H1-like protein Hc1